MAVNNLVLPQLPALREAGWRIHLVCDHGPLDPDVDGLVDGVSFIPMARAISPLRDLRSVTSMIALIRTIRPAVVMGSTPKAAMVSMVGARMADVPVRVFQVRGARWEGGGAPGDRVMRLADQVTARASTDVLAVSPSLARLLVAARVTRRPPVVLGFGGSKGVDASRFFPDTHREVDLDSPRLGFAGRLSIDKGIAELIDVVDHVRRTFPGAVMHLVGDVDRAQPVPDSIVRRLRDDPAFDWHDAVPQAELAVLMREWDLVVLPSRREGLSNLIIEAAACGVPAVAWDVTGVRDAVDDPRTGRLVRYQDVRALAAAAVDCLQPQVNRRMSQNAVEWARTRFDSRNLQDALVAFLEQACRRADAR